LSADVFVNTKNEKDKRIRKSSRYLYKNTNDDFEKREKDIALNPNLNEIGHPSTICRSYKAGRFSQIYTDNIIF